MKFLAKYFVDLENLRKLRNYGVNVVSKIDGVNVVSSDGVNVVSIVSIDCVNVVSILLVAPD